MDTPLVINIDTGVITFRTEENALQCNCRPITRKHAEMLERGEIELAPLLSAIKKHMMSADDFDYEKYASDRRKLNVRHSALHADDRAPVSDANQSDYTTDAEIAEAIERNDDKSDPVSTAAEEVKKQRRVGRPPKTSVDNPVSVDIDLGV